MTIEVPEKLKRFLANPTPQIDSTMKQADKETLSLLKTDIVNIVHKKTGALANSVTVDLFGRKIYSNLPYSAAYELGHYARPKGGRKFLHFVNEQGKDVFMKFTRSRPNVFFFKTLDKDRLRIRQIYDSAFDRMVSQI